MPDDQLHQRIILGQLFGSNEWDFSAKLFGGLGNVTGVCRNDTPVYIRTEFG
jgi:hypothetical protein